MVPYTYLDYDTPQDIAGCALLCPRSISEYNKEYHMQSKNKMSHVDALGLDMMSSLSMRCKHVFSLCDTPEI